MAELEPDSWPAEPIFLASMLLVNAGTDSLCIRGRYALLCHQEH